jgi:hypothetical protein
VAKRKITLILLVFVMVYFVGMSSAAFAQAKPSTAGTTEGASDNGGPAPKIFFPEETHDFGLVARGDKLTYSFKVQNTGDAPLKLIKAKAS